MKRSYRRMITHRMNTKGDKAGTATLCSPISSQQFLPGGSQQNVVQDFNYLYIQYKHLNFSMHIDQVEQWKCHPDSISLQNLYIPSGLTVAQSGLLDKLKVHV